VLRKKAPTAKRKLWIKGQRRLNDLPQSGETVVDREKKRPGPGREEKKFQENSPTR